jgi:hypothetical protein
MTYNGSVLLNRPALMAMDEKKITSTREANQIYYRVSSQDVASSSGPKSKKHGRTVFEFS